MRINSIGLPYSNSFSKRAVNNNITYNPLYTFKYTPSFGKKESIPDDGLLLSYDAWRANPKALLKVIKSQKDNKNASEIFGTIIDLRGEELYRKKMQQEKEKIITEIQNTYKDTSLLLDSLPFESMQHLLSQTNQKVSALEMELSQYSKTKPYDSSKFKIYGKAAKLLSKMPSFDPNYETWDCYLVNDSLRNEDDELTLMLMRHKKYNSLNSYISDENKSKFKWFLTRV